MPEKKADEEATPDALLIAWLNCLANFTSGAAFLAGFEATISLQIFTAYGWGTRESWKAWGPFACSQLLFAVLISPVCIDKLNPNKVWIVCATLMTLSIALGVNWFDLSQPIPVWLFLLENVFANGMVLHNQLLQGLMTSQLPPAKQAKFQALNALAGQVGRAMGPLVATMVFNWAVHAEGAGNGSGANWSRIYMIAVGMPGQFLPALWFRRVYGNWEDKSPSEQKAAKDGVKELAA